MTFDLETRLTALADKGVVLIDPRQVYLGDDVDLTRICRGAVLHPGTRLLGARTFVGEGAQVGTEGPAVIDNGVLGAGASIASGYASGAVLLEGASAGANAHLRPGTIMEEHASTAHCVGLKQTILLSFVTMGSLINFCDALLAGGTSGKNHTEVGSGFIHFNFTPWGETGDKATASLIGDVPRGVFLREQKIFLGGMSGIVGPGSVGFGAVTGAGQVVRQGVAENHIVSQAPRPVDMPLRRGTPRASAAKRDANLTYIGHLTALRAWYREVRLPRIPDGPDYEGVRIVVEEAAETLTLCIGERVKRLAQYLDGVGQDMPELSFDLPTCPLKVDADQPYTDHVAWVQSLDPAEVERGTAWLRACVAAVSGLEPEPARAG